MNEKKQWCEKHWDPVRRDRTINGVYLTLLVTESFLADERVGEFCTPKGENVAKIELLNQAVIRFSPLCCFLGDEKMSELYDQLKFRYAKIQPVAHKKYLRLWAEDRSVGEELIDMDECETPCIIGNVRTGTRIF